MCRLDVSSVKDMSGMFKSIILHQRCVGLEREQRPDMSAMFAGHHPSPAMCRQDVSSVEDMQGMFKMHHPSPAMCRPGT